MPIRLLIRVSLLLVAAGCAAFTAFGQRPAPADDVVRVTTELVQTDFTVLDRDGNFVDGLKREQFQLKVDGKLREITFFDRIAAGSRNEEAQLAAARGNSANTRSPVVPLDRGRVVIFYIDDIHLSASSLIQVRTLLRRFVDREMRQNDLAAIASVTGQAGFLEQLTDNKAVLNAAIARLGPAPQANLPSMENPPMSEYQALQIQQRDQDLISFYVEAILREIPNLSRESAEQMVASRASTIIQSANFYVTRTMAGLKGLVDSVKPVAGRKLLFFISDGFFVDYDRSDNHDRLRRLTAAAARSGTVVYSLDPRGLGAGLPDASQVVAFDPSGRVDRSNAGELTASREAMASLAGDTGGKTIFNTNGLATAVQTAIKETSVYYLIAWRPENDEQRNPKFRKLEVSVAGRPQLVVRFRRGVGETIINEDLKRSKNQAAAPAAVKTPADEMRNVLRAPYPTNKLPVSIALNFVDTQEGPTLTTSIKITTASLPLEPIDGAPTGLIDIAGYVLDDQGKSVGGFNRRLSLRSTSKTEKPEPPESVFYNHAAIVKPGLYQVRVAARDVKLGTIGSAFQWIEVPNLQTKALTLSSLIVGESKLTEAQRLNTNADLGAHPELRNVSRNVDRRFPASSYLRFLTFVYNSARAPVSGSSLTESTGTNSGSQSGAATGQPDLAVQVQVFRDDQPVITTPLSKINTEGTADLQRIPYAADVRLENLPPGAYLLHVTVIDRVAKTSVSQRINFEIE